MRMIDNWLNRLTMYRVVIYVLSALVGLSIAFAFTGRLAFSPTQLVVSAFLILVAAYLTDRGLARYFGVPSNRESALITSLILFLIVEPAGSVTAGLILVLAGAVSSASKFLLAYHGKHVFNPAAFAAAVLSLTGLGATTWWIGSTAFWPFALVLGLIVVRKVRRMTLFIIFVVVSTALEILLLSHSHQPWLSGLQQSLLASPLIFLGTIMLTEPATMPPRRSQQVIFAVIVSVLYVKAWSLGPLVIYPEVALLLGNLLAFAWSMKSRARLRLKQVQRISDRVYNYVFVADKRFAFLPGQYMEWTLAAVPYDSRGNRRTFTIASSPTESNLQVGVKYHNPASAYKAALMSLKPGDEVYASQLAGDFTLPRRGHKLAFIAGGIGITPFRSMLKYLIDKGVTSDIVLLYIVNDPAEFAYVDVLKQAANIGVKVIPVVTQNGYHAPGIISTKISADLFAQAVPDYRQRIFYISGSSGMVDAVKGHLRDMGLPARRIKTDHFSGY